MISTLLKREENKNHLIALKKGRIIQNTSSSSEKEERTKEGIKNTLCEYGCVISRERHTHTQRARTWYIYVVYKPLFSRTFVFFRREILCRVLILGGKVSFCWISDFCFILMRKNLKSSSEFFLSRILLFLFIRVVYFTRHGT